MPPPPEKTFNMEPENQSLELEFPSFSGSMYVKLGGGCTKKHPKGCGQLTANWRFMGFSSHLRNIPQKNIPESNSSHLKIGGFELEYYLSETGMTYFFLSSDMLGPLKGV